MRIELNGSPITTSAETLADLIADQGLDATVIASALNGEFVPRGERESTRLHEGARVEVLSPMQGG